MLGKTIWTSSPWAPPTKPATRPGAQSRSGHRTGWFLRRLGRCGGSDSLRRRPVPIPRLDPPAGCAVRRERAEADLRYGVALWHDRLRFQPDEPGDRGQRRPGWLLAAMSVSTSAIRPVSTARCRLSRAARYRHHRSAHRFAARILRRRLDGGRRAVAEAVACTNVRRQRGRDRSAQQRAGGAHLCGRPRRVLLQSGASTACATAIAARSARDLMDLYKRSRGEGFGAGSSGAS